MGMEGMRSSASYVRVMLGVPIAKILLFLLDGGESAFETGYLGFSIYRSLGQVIRAAQVGACDDSFHIDPNTHPLLWGSLNGTLELFTLMLFGDGLEAETLQPRRALIKHHI